MSASRYDLGCFHAAITEGGPKELWEGGAVRFSRCVTITRTQNNHPEVVISIRLPNSVPQPRYYISLFHIYILSNHHFNPLFETPQNSTARLWPIFSLFSFLLLFLCFKLLDEYIMNSVNHYIKNQNSLRSFITEAT